MKKQKDNSEAPKDVRTEVPSSAKELGTRIAQTADRLGSRKSAAAIAGISVDQLARYISGESQPSLTPIALMASRAGIRLDWIWNGEGQMDGGAQKSADDEDLIAIPEYTVEVSAGHGVVPSAEEIESVWWFSRKLALEIGLNPANLAFIKVRGDSMMPGIREGDLVLIDLTQKRFTADAVYAFILGDMLLVKRIQATQAGEYHAKSDNPAYAPITLKPGAEQVTIVGRVVYAIHSLL